MGRLLERDCRLPARLAVGVSIRISCHSVRTGAGPLLGVAVMAGFAIQMNCA